MWISRDETDSMAPEKMVELAFQTITDVWPIMQQASRASTYEVDSVLRSVSEHLDVQREEMEKLNKQATEMEKCGQQIVKRACTMRSLQEGILKNMLALRHKDTRLFQTDTQGVYDFWENEGKTLKQSMRTYHTNHSRHAQAIKDLQMDADTVVICEKMPHAFKSALDEVKSEIQKEATLRRVQKRKASSLPTNSST
jgi:hypothetical protein